LNAPYQYDLKYFKPRLNQETVALAKGFPVVCSFANDQLNAAVLEQLKLGGTSFIALRSTGFNHVDIATATDLGIKVARVPNYSPHSVAEHAVALILALDRKICRAHNRVRDLNFSLDGLVGFDLYGKTVGVIGTGKIGSVFAKIMTGFGCRVLLFDQYPNRALETKLNCHYVSLEVLLQQADIISLHIPLTVSSRHLIDAKAFEKMKPGVMIINTGRGGLIETKPLINALKSGHVKAAGLDVYEEEEGVFSQDLSDQGLQDDILARLMTFPNVIITAHQAFLTQEALNDIVTTTFENIDAYAKGMPLINEVIV
jgi:D-lactate dehydrogenase